MPDPVTVGLAAVAGKDIIKKILGPTAEYLGEGLKDFTERRKKNVDQIFENAKSKLGERIDTQGEVPPKVLKSILDEGSFSDDTLAIEYFGGILASSRSELGRDDRGARISKILDSMSTYQLRTHYLIYATIRKLFANRGLEFDMEGREKMEIFIPYAEYLTAMDFNNQEYEQISQLLGHIFFGLSSDGLIEANWRYGGKDSLMKVYPKVSDGGIVLTPSVSGVELFLWAFGHGDKLHTFLFEPKFVPAIAGVHQNINTAIALRFDD